MSDTDEKWLDLAGAIIRQAADDYRSARQTKAYLESKPILDEKESNKLRSAKRMIAEVKLFFKSEWYRALCGDADPQYIFERIEGETT